MKQPRNDKTGKFRSLNPEPLGKKIVGIRLSPSMEAEVRQIAGDDLSQWIRQAIAEKLAREASVYWVNRNGDVRQTEPR